MADSTPLVAAYTYGEIARLAESANCLDVEVEVQFSDSQFGPLMAVVTAVVATHSADGTVSLVLQVD